VQAGVGEGIGCGTRLAPGGTVISTRPWIHVFTIENHSGDMQGGGGCMNDFAARGGARQATRRGDAHEGSRKVTEPPQPPSDPAPSQLTICCTERSASGLPGAAWARTPCAAVHHPRVYFLWRLANEVYRECVKIPPPPAAPRPPAREECRALDRRGRREGLAPAAAALNLSPRRQITMRP
jgi:hypothetical protein